MILEDKASSKYIVKPGNKVNLAKLDSSDMALFPDGKSSYQEYFDKQIQVYLPFGIIPITK